MIFFFFSSANFDRTYIEFKSSTLKFNKKNKKNKKKKVQFERETSLLEHTEISDIRIP